MTDNGERTPGRRTRAREIEHLRALLAAEQRRADAEAARADAERTRADLLQRLLEGGTLGAPRGLAVDRLDATAPGHVEVFTEDWALTCACAANPPDAWTRWEPGQDEPPADLLRELDAPNLAAANMDELAKDLLL